MSTYTLFKWIHVITAALWATGLWGLLDSRLRENDTRSGIWLSFCMSIALLIQPVSGFMMILLHAYAFKTSWVSSAWGSYGVTLLGSLWLISASWQKKRILLPLCVTLAGALSALWLMTALPLGGYIP